MSAISELRSMLSAVESQSKTQIFDSETEKRYLREIKEDSHRLESIREVIQKKAGREAELQKNIQNEQNLIRKLKVHFCDQRRSLAIGSRKSKRK